MCFYNEIKYDISQWIEIFNTETKIINNQIQILEWKYTMRIWTFDWRIQQHIWDDRQKNQWTWKEIKRNYSIWKIEGKIEEKWTEPQSTSIYIMGVSEGEKRERGRKHTQWNNWKTSQSWWNTLIYIFKMFCISKEGQVQETHI